MTDIIIIAMRITVANSEAMGKACKPLSNAINVAGDTLLKRVCLSASDSWRGIRMREGHLDID